MATIRLIPSTYTVSHTSYVSFSDTTNHPATNMYANTDSTTYATIRGRNSSNASRIYYCFIHGFNFGDVPSNATISSFAIKIKCYRNSYQGTGTDYRPRLASSPSSSSVISNTTLSSDLTTSAATYTFPNGSLDWNTLKNYGSNFSIEIVLHPSSNQYPYVYVYGAEIEVTYTLPVLRTITSSITGSGTISPSGSTSLYDGDTYSLTITPTNMSNVVTITNNGTDVTSSLVRYESGAGSISQTAASYTTSGTISNSSYLAYPVGYTAENPRTYSNNVYATNDGSTAYAIYSFNFSAIPSNATINSVEVKCCGKAESTSQGTRSIRLYANTTAKGSAQSFTSTTQQVITISNPGTWTRSELQNAKLRFTVGYYGGSLCGITWKVNYTMSGDPHYTYTYTVSGDAVIVVSIGHKLYFKSNDSWVGATDVYKKINGVWTHIDQSDLTGVFSSGVNYVKG